VRRHVGVLKVEAIGAQDLKKYDVLGKSDPFLEVFTLPLHKVLSSGLADAASRSVAAGCDVIRTLLELNRDRPRHSLTRHT